MLALGQRHELARVEAQGDRCRVAPARPPSGWRVLVAREQSAQITLMALMSPVAGSTPTQSASVSHRRLLQTIRSPLNDAWSSNRSRFWKSRDPSGCPARGATRGPAAPGCSSENARKNVVNPTSRRTWFRRAERRLPTPRPPWARSGGRRATPNASLRQRLRQSCLAREKCGHRFPAKETPLSRLSFDGQAGFENTEHLLPPTDDPRLAERPRLNLGTSLFSSTVSTRSSLRNATSSATTGNSASPSRPI